MERYSPEDTGRAMALYNLADSLDDRLMEIDDVANLGQAITLHRSALDPHPAGRLDRHKSLFFPCSLAEVSQTSCDAGLAGRRHSWSSCLGPSSPGGGLYRSVILHDFAIYLNDGYENTAHRTRLGGCHRTRSSCAPRALWSCLYSH